LEEEMTDDVAGETVAEALAAAFDGFEAIRQLARSSEDDTPELFAAFMSAASAAAGGRDPLASAPALASLTGYGPPVALPASGGDPGQAADAIAALAATLAARLNSARPLATTPADQQACEAAAAAARRIRELMAPADDTHAR
jgi:hypothetical protein